MNASYYKGEAHSWYTITIDRQENTDLFLRDIIAAAKQKAASFILDDQIGEAIELLKLADDIDGAIKDAVAEDVDG